MQVGRLGGIGRARGWLGSTSSVVAMSARWCSSSSRHSFKSRARGLLVREHFRASGFRLADVNPLASHGYLTDPESIHECVPTPLQPLVHPLAELRKEKKEAQGKTPNSGGELLAKVFAKSDHISVQPDEAQHISKLVSQYCGSVGFETMHCSTEAEREFFALAAEKEPPYLSEESLEWVFESLLKAEALEELMSRRYPSCKRFSLDGLEASAVALRGLIESLANNNKETTPRVVLGTSHRGRMNFVYSVLGMEITQLVDRWDPHGPSYDDVNEGHSVDVSTVSGSTVHVSLIPMPCHLEAMDPAVAGKARGHITDMLVKQYGKIRDENNSFREASSKVLPVMVHGDAAFCGEGVVSETLQLSTFENYECGGVVHIIANNQIGYTSETTKMRGRHVGVNISDVALGIRAPVLHINGCAPDQVLRCARIAFEYRRQFGKDIVLNIVGFRRYGHNEVDEPRITNSALYHQVDNHGSVSDVFAGNWPGASAEKLDSLRNSVRKEFSEVSSRPHAPKPKIQAKKRAPQWEKMAVKLHPVSKETLGKALEHLTEFPENFTLHPVARRAVDKRRKVQEALKENNLKQPIVDWATAELLGLSSLAMDGISVRLSGQDSQRGTFTQRHASFHDSKTGACHFPLPPLFEACNSPLSEFAVCGFEYGWSMASPRSLALWEAQFGDFATNAETIFDTEIFAGSEKWDVESGLVLLFPHGYDGMGPEHSSCRVERWLQMHTDSGGNVGPALDTNLTPTSRIRDSNFIVLHPTSPSNYFFALRRQLRGDFRRPLVVLSPKRMLRLREATSPLEDFLETEGHEGFREVLDDPRHGTAQKQNEVKSLVFCSGELYYDLVPQVPRETALIRLEQLAPFPLEGLKRVVGKYQQAERGVWVQEEPCNAGAHVFLEPFFNTPPFHHLHFSPSLSRPPSAAPAIGQPEPHLRSQEELMQKIVGWCHGQ